MSNHKKMFSTVELDYWADANKLNYEEKFLIDKYLNKGTKTLEAGTGGGRILLEMKSLGFASLHGFDYVPELIERARQKKAGLNIAFEVQDATALTYEDYCFDQIIYLQQIICLMEEEIGRLKALKEAYRILKSGGTALFSFLSFDARIKNAMYLPYLMYTRLFRKLRGSSLSIQYLPWLKLSGKINFSSLFDIEPYAYWYKLEEVCQILREVDFEIIAIGSSYQIKEGRMHVSLETLVNEPIEGQLYFVCKK